MKFCKCCLEPLAQHEVAFGICDECQELEQEALESQATSDRLMGDYEDMERIYEEDDQIIQELYEEQEQSRLDRVFGELQDQESGVRTR